MSNDVVMTSKGKEELEAELDQLVKVDREKIKKAISEARELGDLKENAEYHAAKESQSHTEGRILEVQSKLNRAKVVDVTQLNGPKILFGATVTLFDPEKDLSITYQIVGDDEAQKHADKISYHSPLGKALIGLEEGDTANVHAPKGNIEYEIESVEYK